MNDQQYAALVIQLSVLSQHDHVYNELDLDQLANLMFLFQASADRVAEIKKQAEDAWYQQAGRRPEPAEKTD